MAENMALLSERIEHSFEGIRYSVSVEAVLWESWKGAREDGLPTPWEVLTEEVADLFSSILYADLGPADVYKVADPMATKWVERFGVCR